MVWKVRFKCHALRPAVANENVPWWSCVCQQAFSNLCARRGNLAGLPSGTISAKIEWRKMENRKGSTFVIWCCILLPAWLFTASHPKEMSIKYKKCLLIFWTFWYHFRTGIQMVRKWGIEGVRSPQFQSVGSSLMWLASKSWWNTSEGPCARKNPRVIVRQLADTLHKFTLCTISNHTWRSVGIYTSTGYLGTTWNEWIRIIGMYQYRQAQKESLKRIATDTHGTWIRTILTARNRAST